MPYIEQQDRAVLDTNIDRLSVAITQVMGYDALKLAGTLNYCVTRLCLAAMSQLRPPGVYPRYSTLCIVRGVLADAAAEIYRRVGAKVEDAAIQRNGDVEGF